MLQRPLSRVGAKRRRSSTHQHTAPWPHHVQRQRHWLPVQRQVSRVSSVSYINRSLQLRRRTCLPTFDSSPSIVILISVHLLTEHCSTDAHQLRGQKFRCCGTAPVEHFAVYVQMLSYRQFGRHLKAHKEPKNHGALLRSIFSAIQILLLTYLLTYLLTCNHIETSASI